MAIKLKKQELPPEVDPSGEEDFTSSMDLKASGLSKGSRGSKLNELMARMRVQTAILRAKSGLAYQQLKAKKLHYVLPLVIGGPIAFFGYQFFSKSKEMPTNQYSQQQAVREAQPVQPALEAQVAAPPAQEAAPPSQPMEQVQNVPAPRAVEPPPIVRKQVVRSGVPPVKAKSGPVATKKALTGKTKATAAKKTTSKATTKSAAKSTKAAKGASKTASKATTSKRAIASKTKAAKSSKDKAKTKAKAKKKSGEG